MAAEKGGKWSTELLTTALKTLPKLSA